MRVAALFLAAFGLLASAQARDISSPDFLARVQENGAAKVSAAIPEDLTVTEYHHTTYGGVVKDAFYSALLGIFMVICGFPVLYFNEKRQVHMDKIFDYACKVIKQNVPADKVDVENEARLVHVKGTTSTEETLRDNQFDVAVQNCAKLSRSVEMYQWVEHVKEETRDTSDGGKDTITTYTYSTSWCSSPQDSSGFKEGGHDNPPMPFEGADYTASRVSLGAFVLTETLIRQMNNFVGLTSQELQPQANIAGRSFQLQNGTYSTCQGSPQIGDMRVTFKKVECKEATVLSIQHDDSFVPLDYSMVPQPGCCDFGSSVPVKINLDGNQPLLGGGKDEINGLCSCIGGLIEMRECLDDLSEGTFSAAEMMNKARSSQSFIHKVLHIVGYFLFFFGWLLQFKFVPTLFRIIPWIGLWIQAFGNFFAYIGAFLMASFCWCITVAYAWLALRPVKAAFLIGAALALIIVPSMMSAQKP